MGRLSSGLRLSLTTQALALALASFSLATCNWLSWLSKALLFAACFASIF
jgi:hypothetical protein